MIQKTCASAKKELEDRIEQANDRIAAMTEENRHCARAFARRLCWICELVCSWQIHATQGDLGAQRSLVREAYFCYQAASKIAEEYRWKGCDQSCRGKGGGGMFEPCGVHRL
eukprot:764790-Hanusia_phi.AAC.2